VTSEDVVTRSEAETEAFGEHFATTLRDSDVVYLIGDLGAGKTCVARGIARGRGASERQVASPTFALLHEYVGGAGEVVLRHLDLYRLVDQAKDLEILGLPEAVLDAPILVEWPGTAIRQVLPPTMEVRLAVRDDGSRQIRVDQKRGG
jgi:tRNA threonylcarbamoyladenosine biosynthesis protein TsaE